MLYGPNEGVLVRAPGKPRSWIDLLPEPWSSDPFVVLILVPDEAKTMMKVDKEGHYAFTTMELDGKEYGLQVVRPDTPKLSEQMYLFQRARVPMARADFVGRMSAIPQGYLMTGHHPIVFLRDDMSKQWINVMATFKTEGTPEQRKEKWS